jgi:hypothetical protein
VSSFDPASDVVAPVGAVGYSTLSGWITDADELTDVEALGSDVFVVDDDRLVRGITGAVTVVDLAHVDRRVLALKRELDERHQDVQQAQADTDHIRTKLLDAAEALETAMAQPARRTTDELREQ